MTSKQLQSVNFFISLPSPIDIPTDVSVPLIEIDGTSEPAAIRFIDNDGVNKRVSIQLTFYQIASTNNLSDMAACFNIFEEYYAGQGGKEAAVKADEFQIKSKVTVVQATCITSRQFLNQNILSGLFDDAINAIRRYLKAYHLVTQQYIQFPTMQTTVAVVPYTVEDIDADGKFVGQRESLRKGVFITQPPPEESTVNMIISDQLMNEIAYASSTYLDNVLDPFFNVRREAFLAYNSGNTIVASILLGMAAEILFDELLLLLLWEEGKLPHEARELFKNKETDTTLKRIKSKQYQIRLGGNWSMDRNKTIGRWRFHIAELRNKIAHIGYEPTQKEMETAVDTLSDLVTYAADLLCTNLEKYPISASLIAGQSGMERRGSRALFEKIIKDLPYPTNAEATFGNWKFEVERLAQDNPFVGNYKTAVTAYLVHANGEQMWLLLDKENRLVKRIPDQTILDSKLRAGLNKSISKAITRRKGQSTLIELQDFRPKYIKEAKVEWTPLYMVFDERSISRWPVSYLPPK